MIRLKKIERFINKILFLIRKRKYSLQIVNAAICSVSIRKNALRQYITSIDESTVSVEEKYEELKKHTTRLTNAIDNDIKSYYEDIDDYLF